MSGLVRRLGLAGAAVLATVLMGAILFLAAGRWDLPMLWAYVGAYGVIICVALQLIDPGLIKERFRPGPGATDQRVIPIMKVLLWIHFVGAGLDVGRFHFSDGVPIAVQIAGLVLFVAGFSVIVWAMALNRFFSSVVRVQEDRGHRVITAGPYRYVRHPGYTGMIVGIPCSALALGSWISAIPVFVFVLLILRRVIIEDRFLRTNLDGYQAYADTVRYRLVPGIW